MTEISSEDSSGSVIYITPLPRIPLALSLDADQSYVDLFDAYARETNLQMIEEDTALDQPRHHYPAVMKSMLGRLEMFGRLANLRDFTQHSKGQKKTKGEDGEENSSEADERFYDLDDGFIDAEYDDSDRENVEDFESAIREGHYTLKPDLFIPFDSRQTSLHPKTSRSRWKDSRIDFNRKRKAKAISSYTPEIQRTLLGLQDLYLAHSGETVAVAYPKEPIQTLDRTDVCLTLSEICGKSLESIEKLAEKQLASNEKLKLGSVHTANVKKLRTMVSSECKGATPIWTKELQEAYKICIDSLGVSTVSCNKYNAHYCKKKPQIDLRMEEKKLEADVADWSSGRFVIENREVQVTVIGHSSATPTILQVFLQRAVTPPPPIVVNLEAPSQPKKGSLFDPMPVYHFGHFQESSTVIDLQ